MRADARRNHDAVLEAGVRVLAERPSASMQEIADASGLGRTTVYRHFPARDDLIAALVERVAEEALAASVAATSEDRPAAEVLRRIAADFVALGRHWSFLHGQRHAVTAAMTESDRVFRDWITGAQERGELRREFEPAWVQAATGGVISAAIEQADGLGVDHAGRVAGETLVAAFCPG